MLLLIFLIFIGYTQAFGDEIVGIFTREYGFDFIINNIKIINANDKVKSALNFVVSYSSEPNKLEAK